MNNKSQNLGFTLIETLVAISILLIAVVGPLTIVAGSIGTSNLAKEQITAHYLAQEAVELIRNIKDNNRLEGESNWLLGIAGSGSGNCDQTNQYCTIDNTNFPPQTTHCPSQQTDCGKIYAHDVNGIKYYNHDSSGGGQETIYKRRIKVTPGVSSSFPNPTEAKITVDVSWKMNASFGIGAERTFTIEEWIYDW